ncbi:MAG: hypothetical protein ACD_63C00104G0003 [uncultured bacterium]|nr:MAG: hypothetical protein ACD_63C00104G0003 [uncultured bacterium]
MKKIIILAIALISFLGVALNASAGYNAVNLTKRDIENGYLLSYKNRSIELAIPKDTFHEPSRVKIEDYEKEIDFPKDLKKVSGVYLYDVKTEKPVPLQKPITLRMKYSSQNSNSKQIYVWDREKGKWVAIPSSVNSLDKSVEASVHAPFSIVAIFEKDGGEIEKIGSQKSPSLTASAAVSLDAYSEKILFQKDPDTRRSIASLTKLMTAQVFLDNNPGWEKEVKIISSDFVGGATLGVRAGDIVTSLNMFNSMLVGSRNNAVKALVRSTGMSEVDFVAKMNKKAEIWGLKNTRFVEPTGLDARNFSTALEYAKLSKKVLQNPEIVRGSTMKSYSFWTKNTNRAVSTKATNKLLERGNIVTGGKTGFTYEAGYCLMSRLRKNRADRAEVINVVLGESRFSRALDETAGLASWAFRNYKWR